jgi:ADP-ribosyl-[dinitrogen reductase] hydrolase
MEMNERARGSFLGLAVGDCLGAPVEGMPAWEIEKRFGHVTEMLDPFDVWQRRPERGRLRGLHTDDTQQAWIVADVLLRHAAIVPDELARRFVSFAQARPDLPRGVHRGTGKAFRAAVERLTQGTPALEAGEPRASNGAAMRVAPIGIRFAGKPEEIARGTVLGSAVTHHDARAIEAAAAVAALVGALVADGGPTTFRGMIEAAIDGARRAENLIASGDPVKLEPAERAASGAVREVLASLLVRSGLGDEELFREIAKAANAHSPDRMIKRATDGFALASVTAAIAIAARAKDFRAAMETSVNAGEDTDSVAAIAGAIAGARFGAAAIPAEWIGALVAKDALGQVADLLGGGEGTPPDQEALEETWTRLERQEAGERARQEDEEDDDDEDDGGDEDDDEEEEEEEDEEDGDDDDGEEGV